jgi:hypothetical protein
MKNIYRFSMIGIAAVLLMIVAILSSGNAQTQFSITPEDDKAGKYRLLKNEDLGDEIGQPGSSHKRLNSLIGRWQMDIKIWNGPHDTEPFRVKGTMERRWALKGRFIKEHTREIAEKTIRMAEYRGRRPVLKAGQIYEGMGFLGFDRLAGIYEHIWVHDDSTRMYYGRGRYEASIRTIILNGSWTDPYDGTYVLARIELKIDGPDQHTIVRYISDEDTGKFKDLKIVFTRSK